MTDDLERVTGQRGPERTPDIFDHIRTRRTQRSIEAIRDQTVRRMAQVQGDGLVASEKARELAHLGRESMTYVAMTANWQATLSGDPFAAEDTKFLADIVKIGLGEIVAGLVSTYTRGDWR